MYEIILCLFSISALKKNNKKKTMCIFSYTLSHDWLNTNWKLHINAACV